MQQFQNLNYSVTKGYSCYLELHEIYLVAAIWLYSGNRVAAIRCLREVTAAKTGQPMGLKEAKEYVDCLLSECYVGSEIAANLTADEIANRKDYNIHTILQWGAKA